jgi:uncharacterized protein (TIGR03435 family)
VKPSASSSPVARITATGDRLTYSNSTLLNDLARAYEVKGYQIDGPSWIKTERYDIVAKAPDNTPKDQILIMLQALLTERFQLKLHREQREMPVYLLVIGKRAPKFQKSEGPAVWTAIDGRRVLKNHTMIQLAEMLTRVVERPVLDRTGLQGAYTIPLEDSFEELGGLSRSDAPSQSIFTLLEAIGLKLESRHQPVEVIVVDSGNKVPKEN